MNWAAFIAMFPEFTNSANGSALFDIWYAVAQTFVNINRWGAAANPGLGLATAHFITLALNNAVQAGSGTGLVNSQAAGPMNVSYDTENTAVKDFENWNATSYGQQYAMLAKMMGAGALQIG